MPIIRHPWENSYEVDVSENDIWVTFLEEGDALHYDLSHIPREGYVVRTLALLSALGDVDSGMIAFHREGFITVVGASVDFALNALEELKLIRPHRDGQFGPPEDLVRIAFTDLGLQIAKEVAAQLMREVPAP